MNILKVTSKFNSLFLAVILVAGTIVAFSPSFMTADAQSESYYGMDKDRKSYGKDVNVKSIKCNNVNVNINGLELNVLPPALSTLLTGGEADDNAYSYGSGERNYGSGQSGSDNDFKFICINNNNNTVVVGEEPPAPIPPVEECAETDEIETCFEQFLTDEEFPRLVAALESGITITINGVEVTLSSFNDICLAFEGLTTYQQLNEAVDNILIDADISPGEDFFAIVDCIGVAIGIPPIPPG